MELNSSYDNEREYMQNILYIDVGGSYIKYSTVNTVSKTINELDKPNKTPKSGKEIARIVKQLLERYAQKVNEHAQILIGIPGVKSSHDRQLWLLPHLNIEVSLDEAINPALIDRCLIVNDAEAQLVLLTEMYPDISDTSRVLISIGTSIVAITMNNKVKS